MIRHSEGCDCPPCEKHFRQRNLWLGSIFAALFAALFAIATVNVAWWLYQLLSR